MKHKPGKQIPNADYLSHNSGFEEPEVNLNTKVAFTDYLPISRNLFIQSTRNAYGPVLAGMKSGWPLTDRKRFADLYANRDKLTTTADGVLLFQDRPLIHQVERHTPALQCLHTFHFGRNKIVSLARQVC